VRACKNAPHFLRVCARKNAPHFLCVRACKNAPHFLRVRACKNAPHLLRTGLRRAPRDRERFFVVQDARNAVWMLSKEGFLCFFQKNSKSFQKVARFGTKWHTLAQNEVI